MTALADGRELPDRLDMSAAELALPQIRHYLVAHPSDPRVELRAAGQRTPLVVPRAAVVLLEQILQHMAAGEGVSVVPARAELTSQQAADLLNVSRPFLIGLLDAGEIEYRKVGTHRRIHIASLLEYIRADKARRRMALDELSASTQEMRLT